MSPRWPNPRFSHLDNSPATKSHHRLLLYYCAWLYTPSYGAFGDAIFVVHASSSRLIIHLSVRPSKPANPARRPSRYNNIQTQGCGAPPSDFPPPHPTYDDWPAQMGGRQSKRILFCALSSAALPSDFCRQSNPHVWPSVHAKRASPTPIRSFCLLYCTHSRG